MISQVTMSGEYALVLVCMAESNYSLHWILVQVKYIIIMTHALQENKTS